MKKLEAFLEWGGMKKDILLLTLSGVALLCSILGIRIGRIDPSWIAVVLCGVPIVLEAVIGLATEFDIKADVLVSLALLASLMIGEYFAAGEVAFIMQLGALLEDITVAKAKSGIEKLVHLTPSKARRIREGREELIEAKEVRRGDILRVLPGEMIPADGVLLHGETSVDQSVMTGEPIPEDKKQGDLVKSGTMNQYGTFDMQASCEGADSSMQRLIQLVQSADAEKAKIVRIADKWATWIVVIALAAAFLTFFLTGEMIRSVTILVVFCPCALVLATPTAIMAGIGNLTERGVLVRQGDALERMAEIHRVTFDKTGTLTHGKPRVTAVKSFLMEIEEKELYALTAAVEGRSEHPLGKAVAVGYQTAYQESLREIEEFQMFPGQGVMGRAGEAVICAGNLEFVRKHSVWSDAEQEQALPYMEQGCTMIYIARQAQAAGFLALSDTLRPEASSMIEEIKHMGIEPVLLTGDRREAAGCIATQAGISEVHAGCLPEDKMKILGNLQEKGEKVCMIGDGINDAPALRKAYVSIAMGGIGSDIAIEAADMALIGDDISAIPHTIALSRRMMKTIKWNMIFSMGINTLAILLAMAGMLGPVAGAFVHNGGSVLVILNSARLLKAKFDRTQEFPQLHTTEA